MIVTGAVDGRADDGTVAAPPVAQLAQSSEHALRPNINCTCRFRGQDFGIGESVCIRGALATCSTFLNNTSWSISKTPCPVAYSAPVLRRPNSG